MQRVFRWGSKWWPGLVPLVVFWAIAAWTNTAPLEFDLAARVYKGVPAPTNLTIPPYKFLTDTRLLVGSDGKSA